MKYAFEDIKDQVVVITGSGRGIGKCMAEVFADQGAKIVISDVDETVMNETADEIGKRNNGEVLAVACNIADSSQAKNLIQKTVEKWGRVDCLINNAGITKDGLFVRMKEEQWQSVIDINLSGTFHMSQAAVNVMRKARKGNVINISSIARAGAPGQTNYSASKAGVAGFTKALSREINSWGIRVNAIAPGFVHTRMTDAIPDKLKDELLKQIPMKRQAEPIDIAKVALFLASNMAAYISGQILDVNGGITGF